MITKRIISTAIAAGAFISFSSAASAQIRIDQRFHSTAGSCAGCDLSQRAMTGLKLHDSDFSSSLFNGSNLSGASFDRSNLSNAHFRKALMLRVVGQNVNMSDTIFQDATMTEASLIHGDFQRSDLRRADLSRTTFNDTNFSGANLTGAIAPDSTFIGSNFISARLNHINFQNADLSKAVLRNATFGNAVLVGTTVEGADMTGADLSQVQGLRQEQLDTACGDMDTQLPVGLSIPYCEAAVMGGNSHREHSEPQSPKLARASATLDDALKTLEDLMADPPSSDKKLKRKLQAIHANIAASRNAIEQ